MATVLAMKPDVLILDEPTAGLDDEAARRVTEILAGLHQAMLVISHDREFLDRLMQRTYRLANGHLSPLSCGGGRWPA